MHNWAPFTVPNGVSCPKMILVDTTQFLTAISINTSSSPKKVTVQTGALLENVMAALEAQSLGFTASPAVGKITMGGALAINAHGAAVRANGETPISGKTYGSLSNLVLSITAVVWNAANSQYQLRTFQRNEPGCTALLTNLGRSFITDVTLQVGTNVRLRCQSWFDKTADELFAPAGSSGNTFSSYLTRTGRVEAIYFPYTTKPWLKVWSVAPYKPILSREVTRPYNYPFSDSLGQELVDLQAAILAGDWSKAPDFCNLQYNVVAAGLITTNSWDLWGWSKNTLLYIKPTTLRAAELGYAILCRRADVQRVLNEFYVAYKNKVAAYQAQGRYPMNAPVELRVCGLDNPNEVVGVSGAPSPQLSTLRPRPDHPEWDCAVWLNMLTIPGTPYSTNFYREMEQWILSNYSSYAGVRVEWSKGWAYTNAAGWADSAIISSTIPNSLRAGYPTGDNFDTARTTLNQFDPARIFSSPLIDAVLP
jgi:FAD/FMN-containing dehydrogenase